MRKYIDKRLAYDKMLHSSSTINSVVIELENINKKKMQSLQKLGDI